MEVEIMRRETIKPSSPTPQNLRHYKLSLQDQELAVYGYTSVVLFYSSSEPKYEPCRRSDSLRKSLSKALNHLYPLAGRISKDRFTIDCNDEGVDFIETKVSLDISEVLKHPKINLLQQLLPRDPYSISVEHITSQVILAIQINHFACGGMVVGVCIGHVIGDASSLATFLNTWASINCHKYDSKLEDGFIFDPTALFPPRDFGGFSAIPSSIDGHAAEIPRISRKRFVFEGSGIASLTQKAGNQMGSLCKNPTRVEAVSALLWGAVIAAAKERNCKIKKHSMFTAVDIRKRMNPPLPPKSFGNLFLVMEAAAHFASFEDAIDYKMLVKSVQNSIEMVTDVYVRKMQDPDEYNAIQERIVAAATSDEVGFLHSSSWCRFPVYEADFGWGKPSWVGNGVCNMNAAILMDTSDGKGIEAWVGLAEEDMKIVEQNEDFLAYVSFSQSL